MRSTLRWMLGVVAVLALTGCGAGSAAGPADRSPPSQAPPGDPVDLVGLWQVTGAAEEQDGAILRLADQRLSIWRGCGVRTRC